LSLEYCARDIQSYLQHLDERNAQEKIRLIAANQAQAEEEANRADGAQINLAGHFDSLPSIK
jgi:hypothetical protein